MKLSSPHFQTVCGPSIVDVSCAIDELAARRREAEAGDYFVLLESADDTGAFVQAVAVGEEPRWMIEVCNSEEAALRALREPVTRGRAVELLGQFVQGNRTLGNGAEWLDVDLTVSNRHSRRTGVLLGVVALLAAALIVWLVSHRA